MKSVLVTFGCSWTYGVGVGYNIDMSRDEYMKIGWDIDTCSKKSFRGLLSLRYDLQNINFAHGGASNQRQFRLLKNFLVSPECQQLIHSGTTIIVLHGITSTARNEMYFNEKKCLMNFKYDDSNLSKWNSVIVEHFYNHDNEVNRLAEEMQFINQYYKATGIKNLWFDTFNHHQYPVDIDNLIENNSTNRDFLTYLALSTGLQEFDDTYHLSSWKTDSTRVKFLVNNGYLNPFTKHPTEQSHKLIADHISTHIEKVM